MPLSQQIPDTTQVQQTADSVTPWNTAPSSTGSDSVSPTTFPDRQNRYLASGASSPNIGLILVIVLFIVLIALVIILVVLLIQHAHQAMMPLQMQLALMSR